MDRLLQAFRRTFEEGPYLHRRPYTGDVIAAEMYEDLHSLSRSPKLVERVNDGTAVVNTSNQIKGRKGRRGDGTLGVLVPGTQSKMEAGHLVHRGAIATLHVGTEVKIVATKMTAQIDRVMSDLRGQADIFVSQNPKAIRVAVVGVNFASEYTGHEGTRSFDAKTPPGREAPEIVRRLDQYVRPAFDEFLILKFLATNRPPYSFAWVDEKSLRVEYASALVRISDEYEQRF